MNFQKELFYQEFVQRENEFLRAPYNPEIEFYTTIKTGDTARVKELLEAEPFIDKPGLGTLSKDSLQNMKYHFVITTALVSRYCIQGGMELSEAYSLSDFYIQKADLCKRTQDVSALHPVMCMNYTKRMKNLRKNAVGSMPVVKCIDYIYDHLHSRITVEELAEYTGLTSSYLSRLFKKEVGMPVSEYIRTRKIDTAKNMLVYSEYRPAQIASILAFPSQSYFTEVFRKKTGYTPAEYRKIYFQVSMTGPE